MFIDISSISLRCNKSRPGSKMDVDINRSMTIGDYEALVSLTGVVTCNENNFVFTGSIEGEIKTFCSGCLKQLSFPYKSELTQIFSYKGKAICEDDEPDFESDILFFDGCIADFTPVVFGIIRGDMPISMKCSDSCKGLCSLCGSDLNVSVCGCGDNYVNPAFEKLKELVFDNDETDFNGDD